MAREEPSTDETPEHPDDRDRLAHHFPPDYQSSFEMALTSALCLVVACGGAYVVFKMDARLSVTVFAGVTGSCFFLAGIVEALRALRHARRIIGGKR